MSDYNKMEIKMLELEIAQRNGGSTFINLIAANEHFHREVYFTVHCLDSRSTVDITDYD